MPTPNKEMVLRHLDPIAEKLVQVIESAWKDWQESSYKGRWICNRSRAVFIWEQIIHHAGISFTNSTEVNMQFRNESIDFLVNDEVLFRIKKADEYGISSNIPTQQALAFHDPHQNLFGLPDIQRVEVTYSLNKLQTQISDIAVIARDGNTPLWRHSLLRDVGSNTIIQPLNPMPTPPTTEGTKHLVKVKDSLLPSKKKYKE